MHIDELIEKENNKAFGPEKRPNKHLILKLILLAILISILCLTVFLILMLQKPSGYESPQTIEDNQVSKYLTHVISQDLYNGAQLGVPFDLIITEEGMNDIIVRSEWPRQTGKAIFHAPQVRFTPDIILIQGIVDFNAAELFVEIDGTAFIDENALLHLDVNGVKIGALTITTIAKIIASIIYNDEITKSRLDENDWRAKIMTSLLTGMPFEPVFEIDHALLRIDKVKIESQKLTIHFIPVDYE
ncbi:MAG: hypothetical protein WC374_00020 [Phycisphaerae bacterium]|jgi:hypothetical protein